LISLKVRSAGWLSLRSWVAAALILRKNAHRDFDA
jgi:hypothetical protein